MHYCLAASLKKVFQTGKNILVALVTLLSTIVMIAQPAPVSRSAIDSFQNIIKGKAADTSKVHAFYWLSRGTTLGNSAESLEWGIKALIWQEK